MFKKFSWFALTHFFDLHIKSLINLKIVSATFGIVGQLPPGYAAGCKPSRAFQVGPGVELKFVKMFRADFGPVLKPFST